MPLIVLSLSFLCFTVYVNSQGCVEGDIDCNKAVPTAFKLSDASCPCDDASHDGALKFANDEVYVCSDKEWKMVPLQASSLVSGPYGSEGNPGLSCDDIYDERIRDGSLEDGIYWLRLPLFGSQKHEAFPVYCDMKNKGWTMIFKGISGREPPANVYFSKFVPNEFEKKAIDLTDNVKTHYKNRIVLFWASFDPAQARVTFHKGGSVRKSLTFDAQNSNFESWFQQRNLIESSWSDLKNPDYLFFSLSGYCHYHKHICLNFQVIKRPYNPTCDTMFGWIFRGTFDECKWERSNMNNIVYCAQQTICQLQNEGSKSEHWKFPPERR
ncbi:uncharacterized protein LOC114962365 isoform X2 [Acropora millepora]|uniref:uncharacterized protein LOC114962365 isoform X2 n=1 Tax=Acropora millepora TaxID=45264 RepID=UPI001CF59B4D|nr:uncharacterized protein LOC114962365 isoform X2 [Acropora millepora]